MRCALACSPTSIIRPGLNEARLISFHNCYCGNSPHSPFALPQPRARASAVLGNEPDAGRFERRAQKSFKFAFPPDGWFTLQSGLNAGGAAVGEAPAAAMSRARLVTRLPVSAF